MSCSSCNELQNHAPDFLVNKVNRQICNSLKNDTGLNPNAKTLHDDFTDLTLANDCLIDSLKGEILKYDACDTQEFIDSILPNFYTMYKSIICSLGGAWEKIHDLQHRVSDNVIRSVRVNFPKGLFNSTNPVIIGSGDKSAKCYFGHTNEETYGKKYLLKVNVSDMIAIKGVYSQTHVKGNVTYPMSVNVQNYYKEGNILYIDYDVYEWADKSRSTQDVGASPGVPYDTIIDFLIIGTK